MSTSNSKFWSAVRLLDTSLFSEYTDEYLSTSKFTVLKIVFSMQTKWDPVTHKDDKGWYEESPWK